MPFAPKPGCPMCGIVSAAAAAALAPSSPSSHSTHDILWRDDNFTVYREQLNPVSSKGHIVVVFNLHVPSLYTLSSSDLPLLVTLRDSLLNAEQSTRAARESFRVGFITPPFRDNKIPVTDHLHAHAYALPADLMGWWRSVAYSSVAWYDIDDLIAEIREETSNNRVRTGANPRPIDLVPDAGARRGTADGIETTDQSLLVADPDPERGETSPNLLPPTPGTARARASPDASIPHLQV
ncbi:hypothetical protein BC628DRAFT_1409407 [Trametes gibbosa]|nr:hypothetical protein BC628DRAFT_1411820 [Trametes gibbosa]KAI0828366.1 hypothetical protein BC628DRAFT_1409407 [Trametes gibbosa]